MLLRVTNSETIWSIYFGEEKVQNASSSDSTKISNITEGWHFYRKIQNNVTGKAYKMWFKILLFEAK